MLRPLAAPSSVRLEGQPHVESSGREVWLEGRCVLMAALGSQDLRAFNSMLAETLRNKQAKTSKGLALEAHEGLSLMWEVVIPASFGFNQWLKINFDYQPLPPTLEQSDEDMTSGPSQRT